MLLQQRKDGGLWTITQYEHARLSGIMAHAWKGLDEDSEPLSFETIFATTLHDFLWLEADSNPAWNPKTQRPYGFTDLPLEQRIILYAEGLDRLEKMDPRAAILVSLHFSSFAVGTDGMAEYLANERQRQARLMERLGFQGEATSFLATELKYLQMFDLLSLMVCLTPPESASSSRPPWLYPKDIATTPKGSTFSMHWEGNNHLVCEPSPWRAPFTMVLPHEAFKVDTFEDEASWQTAWENRSSDVWHIKVS